MIGARTSNKHERSRKGQLPALFEPAAFFMLRAPVLSTRQYVDAFSRQSSSACQRNDAERGNSLTATLTDFGLFREAVAVASPSVDAALLRSGQEKDPRKVRQVELKVSRYLSRMTTRPTPFGLFSGVAVGKFDGTADARLREARTHRKRSRPDMGWLMRVVHGLEQRIEVLRQLKVTSNAAVLHRGGRILLPYFTQHGIVPAEGERTEAISVRLTPVVADVLDRAQGAVSFAELVDFLVDRYPTAGAERAEQLLEQLLRQEFLLSCLRPPLTLTDPLGYLIEQLSNVGSAAGELAALEDVRDAMRAYDALPPGEGTDAYRALRGKMSGLTQEGSPVQVDLALAAEEVRLPRAIGEEAAKAAECLWRLSDDRRGMAHLRSYHQDFLERFGVDREVPVLELLDEDLGLGAPATYTFPEGRRKVPEEAVQSEAGERDLLLMQLMVGALNRGESEVELTEELVAELAPSVPDPASAPLSVEVYAQVVSDSGQAIDEGDYQLVVGPNPGSPAAGMTFGRFLDVLGQETREKLRTVQERVSSLRPDAVFAEIVYQPRAGRSANVCVAPSWRDYSVVVGTNAADGSSRLPLSDLRVGATLDRLYLTSASLSKEVVVTANNMLNPRGAPNFCRFLYELGYEGVRAWQPFSWGVAGGAPMLPRVRYSKTILTPAQWRVDRKLLSRFNGLKDDLDWEIAVACWKQEWRVPRHVLLSVGDQRVLLDLEHPLHLADLRKEIECGKQVILQEMPGGVGGQWVKSPDGPHVAEFVFPLIRAASATPRSPLRPRVARRRLTPDELTRLPGSDWLFAKLYVSRERQDDLVAGPLAAFAEAAVREGLTHEWFFIRYADPEPHLRVRFQGDPGKLTAKLMPALHAWVEHLYGASVVSRFSIDSYEREVERYGGPDAIDPAESLFAADSRTTTGLLRVLHGRELRMEATELAALSIIDLLDGLGWGFDRQLAWLLTTGDKEEFRKEFRERRRKLMEMSEPSSGWQALKSLLGGEAVVEAWWERRGALRKYGERLRILEAEGGLWSPPERVVGSLVHMHCNRLLGVDREAERMAVAYVRHTLHSQQQRRSAAK